MKKATICLSALTLCCLFLASCTNKITLPVNNTSSTPTPTVPSGSTTISLYTPSIVASLVMQDGYSAEADVILTTDTQIVSNAAITLTGPSGFSMPLTYTSGSPSGGYYGAFYDSVVTWPYTANVNYTMTVSYSGHTYQSTIHSVGNVVFSSDASNVYVTWAGGGDLNNISVIGPSSTTYGPSVTSPYTIPRSTLTSDTGSNYSVSLNAEESLFLSPFSGGAFIASGFSSTDQESANF